MMTTKMRRPLLAATIAVLAFAVPARAEVLLTPFGGVAFSGSTERARGTYGAALAFMGGVAGFELEFAFTPSFFGGQELASVFTSNNVVTMMGSLIVASPGPLRIYGAAGLGLLKTRLEDPSNLLNVDSNEFGFNAGGGIIVPLGEQVGLRADIRYFRDFEDDQPDGAPDIGLGEVSYWRGVGGITIRF